MKILVTGANGYLGQGIVKSLLEHGHEVVAADYKFDKSNDKAEKIPCDLFSIDDPYKFFGQPDVLLHLAWRDGFKHYSDAHIEDFPKHCFFIRKFAECEVKMISIMGSMHEIGFFEGCIKNDTPCNPITPYGISKNALREYTEMICKKNNKSFQWLRGYYIVGNNTAGCSIFSKIAKAENEGMKEFPFTQGQNQYDFLDYEEFCEQVSCDTEQTRYLGIINICSGMPETLASRDERFIKENKYNSKLIYGAFPDRPYDSKAIWGDNERITHIMSSKSSIHL